MKLSHYSHIDFSPFLPTFLLPYLETTAPDAFASKHRHLLLLLLSVVLLQWGLAAAVRFLEASNTAVACAAVAAVVLGVALVLLAQSKWIAKGVA